MAAWNDEELTHISMPPAVETMVREGRLVHALCIEGAPGIGRRRLAHSLAGAVLCEKQQGPMCGVCLACRKVLAGVHSDVVELDGSDGGYKKDAVRQLRSQLFCSPSEGRAKVIILNEAQNISPEVQNLLLNVMEEPPVDTYFFLTCDNRYKLLSTVRSRAVTVALAPMGLQACAALLREQLPGKAEEAYIRAALYADGSPGRGRELLENEALMSRCLTAEAVLAALSKGGGYPLLTALLPAEKNRQEYSLVLEMVDKLLNIEQLRQRLGLGIPKVIQLKKVLSGAVARNESNGYLPLISAAMAEEILHP